MVDNEEEDEEESELSCFIQENSLWYDVFMFVGKSVCGSLETHHQINKHRSNKHTSFPTNIIKKHTSFPHKHHQNSKNGREFKS